MPVWPVAQVSVWALPSPLTFMNLQWLLSSYAGHLTILFLSLCLSVVAACHPFSLLIHLVVYSLRYRLNMGASLALITLVLRLTGRSNWLFLFHNCTDTYALSTHTFSFYFNLGVILIYSPRSYEAGAFLISALRGLPPALDNDFSMNLPFSLPTSLCLWAINKTCIHR